MSSALGGAGLAPPTMPPPAAPPPSPPLPPAPAMLLLAMLLLATVEPPPPVLAPLDDELACSLVQPSRASQSASPVPTRMPRLGTKELVAWCRA